MQRGFTSPEILWKIEVNDPLRRQYRIIPMCFQFGRLFDDNWRFQRSTDLQLQDKKLTFCVAWWKKIKSSPQSIDANGYSAASKHGNGKSLFLCFCDRTITNYCGNFHCHIGLCGTCSRANWCKVACMGGLKELRSSRIGWIVSDRYRTCRTCPPSNIDPATRFGFRSSMASSLRRFPRGASLAVGLAAARSARRWLPEIQHRRVEKRWNQKKVHVRR